jgi:hypothetical protein
MELKQKLVELIEAYATAKSTGNATLITLVTQPLQDFLNVCEITVVSDQEDSE